MDMPVPPTPEERLRAMLAIARLPERPSYRPSEVAALLRINKSTVYRMILDGSLGSITLQYRKRVDWTSLVNLIAQEPNDP